MRKGRPEWLRPGGLSHAANKGRLPPKKNMDAWPETFFSPHPDSLIACAVCVSAAGVYSFHGVRPCLFSQNVFISLCIRSSPPLWSPPAGVPVRAPPPAGNIGPISAAGILFSGISFLILQGDERRYAQKTEDIGGVGQV